MKPPHLHTLLSRTVMNGLVGIVPLAVLLAIPWLVVGIHRLPDPPPLSLAERSGALALARAAVVAGASGGGGTGVSVRPTISGALESQVTGSVFVTVYLTGLGPLREPPVGSWSPGQAGGPVAVSLANSPTDSLAAALEQAGRAAGEAVKGIPGGPARLPSARIKIDLAGPARPVWGLWDGYLQLVIDPGRDGLMAELEGRRAWFLPSWAVERAWSLERTLKWLRTKVGQREGALTVSRFRTRSFVEGTEDEPGPLEVFRGNVLVSEVNAAAVRRSLELGGAYLARMIDSNGRYCYTYDAGRDSCDGDYNLLRHAGTTYSLYQIYREVPDPATLEAAERAMEWLRRQVREVSGDPGRAYLIEGRKAKLGAVGLGLLAFVEREKVVKDGRDRALMTRLADFIRSQQRSDGYLESWFAFEPGVVLPKENSIYYPGEALLGIVRLHDLDPQPRYLETAVRAATYLALKRWRWGGIELYVPPDAWLTQGIADLYRKVKDPRLKAYCYELIDVTDMGMLRAEEGAAPDMDGGPGSGMTLPSVTPAGSRNEGMTAAYAMAIFAGDLEQAAHIRALSLRSTRFQLSQQLRPANSWFLPNPGRALGGFRSRADRLDVRIDYVQHNATGLVGVLHLLEEGPR